MQREGSHKMSLGGRVEEARPTFGWDSLSESKRRVADLVARGHSNKEVAERLYMSHRTVGSHLYHIFPKLGLRSRVELARVVIERSVSATEGVASQRGPGDRAVACARAERQRIRRCDDFVRGHGRRPGRRTGARHHRVTPLVGSADRRACPRLPSRRGGPARPRCIRTTCTALRRADDGHGCPCGGRGRRRALAADDRALARRSGRQHLRERVRTARRDQRGSGR